MNGEGDAEVRQNREIASEDNGRRGGPSSLGTAAPLDALSDSQVSTSTALARIKFTAKMLGSLIQLEVNKGFSEKGIKDPARTRNKISLPESITGPSVLLSSSKYQLMALKKKRANRSI